MEDLPIKKEWRGRRTKLTRKIIAHIAKQVRKGATYRAAALASGVSEAAFYNWIARGNKEDSGIYKEFVEALNASSAVVEIEITESIIETIKEKNDGRVGLEWLRRRRPEEWNIPERSEIAQTGALSFVVDLGGELSADNQDA